MDITKTLKKSKIKGRELGRALFSYLSMAEAPPVDFNEASTRLTTVRDKRIYTAYITAANNLVDGATYREALEEIVASGGSALRAEVDLLTAEGRYGGKQAWRFTYEAETHLKIIRALLALEAYNVIIQELFEQENMPDLFKVWGSTKLEDYIAEFEVLDAELFALISFFKDKGQEEKADELRATCLPIVKNFNSNREEYTSLREGRTMFSNIEEFAAVSVMAHIRRFTCKRDNLQSFGWEGQAND